MRHTIQVRVEDKQGVLMQVTGVIAAEGASIDSLTMTPDHSKRGLSTITIVADLESQMHQHLIGEISRLAGVILTKDVTGKAVAAPGSNSAPGLPAASERTRRSTGQSGDWRSRSASAG